MVIDTSALVAILLGEPEAKKIARVIANDNKRLKPRQRNNLTIKVEIKTGRKTPKH